MSPQLAAAWVREHRRRFDVYHLHFGYEKRTVAQMEELCEALEECGRPLVLTVHDLRNPHQVDPGPHRRHLDLLVPRSTAVVTLTPGAAQVISSLWSRDVEVIPHPHVVPLDLIGRARSQPSRPVVGVHLKSGRANSAGPQVARALDAWSATASVPVTVRVDANADEGGAREVRRAAPAVVRMHPRFDDADLWSYLRSLTVSVLPYRFGTHSGWLEACRDLGTAVVAPSHGFYAEQGPCDRYRIDEESMDAPSLGGAVERALHGAGSGATTAEERRQQRVEIAAAYEAVYRRSVAALGAPS